MSLTFYDSDSKILSGALWFSSDCSLNSDSPHSHLPGYCFLFIWWMVPLEPASVMPGSFSSTSHSVKELYFGQCTEVPE